MRRRRFLKNAGKALAGASVSAGWVPRLVPGMAQTVSEQVISLWVDRVKAAVRVPADFVGLGYEMSSAAKPGLLSPTNTRYVRLVRNLGRGGVMRFGGIVADYTDFEAEGTARTDPKHSTITRASLRQVRAFLDSVGWSAIWSVNFGRGTLEQGIAEAREVAAILGPRLMAVELGNEVENYGRGTTPLRPAPYTFPGFRAEYARWHAAIAAAVPGLRFAAPDTAASVEWVEEMAAEARGTVQLLTTHYYRGGQTQGTPEQLATPDPDLPGKLQRLRTASLRSGIPWRMCETNSFFGGGRPGLSNTLLGALWTLDYMLLLAQFGCAGVNMETGVNQLGFISSYSPIQDDGEGLNSAGAPYYGMLAAAQAFAGGTELLPLRADRQIVGVTAYGLGRNGQPGALVVVNRNGTESANIAFGDLGMGRLRALRLSGPTEFATEGLTFAGSAVDAEGQWAPKTPETVQAAEVRVSPMSAVVLLPADAV